MIDYSQIWDTLQSTFVALSTGECHSGNKYPATKLQVSLSKHAIKVFMEESNELLIVMRSASGTGNEYREEYAVEKLSAAGDSFHISLTVDENQTFVFGTSYGLTAYDVCRRAMELLSPPRTQGDVNG